MVKRISFFIDGFNLYHSIKENAKECKWLDLHSLCKKFILEGESIQDIFYFTALPTWNADKTNKHKIYIKALRTKFITPVYGKFKIVSKCCHLCGKLYPTHEEKQSDVNIAMFLFAEAMKDSFDTAIIISGDSDLIPPIRMLQEHFPSKKIGVLIPYSRCATELKNIADFSSKIKKEHLIKSLFPKEIILEDNSKIKCPDNW